MTQHDSNRPSHPAVSAEPARIDAVMTITRIFYEIHIISS